MVEIPLANGRGIALVDDADFEMLNQHSWCCIPNGCTNYAFTWLYNPRRHVAMHQLLCPTEGDVDHIDGNGLNNQRHNLRACTHSQNMMNARPKRGKRFKGVSFVKATGRWRAYIQPQGMKQINLGFYATEEDAARAYDKAALDHFGEFARLNFPPPAIQITILPKAA